MSRGFNINDFLPALGGGEMPDYSSLIITESTGFGSDFSVGNLIGEFVPIPLVGNLLGGVLDGFMSIGRRDASVFAGGGSEMVKKVFDRLVPRYKNDISKLLTEMSLHLNFALVKYRNDLADSSAKRTKKGNGQAVETIKKAISQLKGLANDLKATHTITANTSSYTFPKSLPLFDRKINKGSNIGVRTIYTAVEKKNTGGVKVETKKVLIDGVPTEVPVIKKGFNPLILVAAVVLGVIGIGVWLWNKFKK